MTSWAERFKLVATVGLILLKEDKILLIKRSKTGYMDGYYGLPGGCIDGNETVVHAAIREAHEEANIVLKPEWLQSTGVAHSKFMSSCGEIETIDFFFLSTQYEGIVHNNEPHKHESVSFYPLDQLPQPLQVHTELGLKHLKSGIHFTLYGW